ncbi:MAG TPA: tetratricopeptide repeat protein [Streptosporangiaceae bacterium]|nr:tetratricopeptide repeat protein [Streptosporangiaceae bacterium]
MAEPELSFAGLLRQLRTGARPTQEELAEAAGLSPRSVSDLERGINRTARRETAGLLADALSLTGRVRALFVAAARGRAPAADVLAAENDPGTPTLASAGPASADTASADTALADTGAAAATRALPRDIGSFTGRGAELARLLAALADSAAGAVAGIYAIDGMAGAGKTALAVHAAHRLAGSFPDGQYFVPLHAHTPGQRPADPADALASLLLSAGVTQRVPPGLEARAGRWRDLAAGRKILLVLDDAAGHEQVRPLLPATGGSLVLITSRRRLTALEDATVLSLGALPPADAAALLARLAGRPDLGPDCDATREITRLCGYLPLAIGMLARQLRHHPARGGAELAASLAAARDRLAVMRAENLSVAAAFELSYQDLTPDQQRLFRRLGLAPGTDIDAFAAAALDDTGLEAASARLDELYDHHLLSEPAAGRYLLHDLLREYAGTLAAADDDAQSRSAVGRLVNYHAHVAAAAGQHIATWTTAGGRPPPGDPPAHAPRLADSREAVAWLEAERPNLNAAVAFAAGPMPAYAIAIATAMGGFLRSRGHWDQAAGQYETALGAARRAADRPGQAGTLDELGLLQQLTGAYPAAIASLTEAAQLYRDLGDLAGQAYALNHLGLVQQDKGDFRAAAASHRQALALARSVGDQLAEAVSLTDLGQVQQATGEFAAAIAGHRQALAIFRSVGSRFDEADALCQLGFAAWSTGDYDGARSLSQEALEMFRSLGDKLGQTWALSGLALVQQTAGDYPAAAGSLGQALRLDRELGSRHGEVKTLNGLGDLSAAAGANEQARDQYGQALAIARELGAAAEEAAALAGIGRSLLPGQPAEAAGHLRQALAIYQRIGSPEGRGVQATLDALGSLGELREHPCGMTSTARAEPAADRGAAD